MKTIETYLPVFSGFYGGYFESEADYQAENEYEYFKDTYYEDLDFDDLDFDYQSFYNECAECMVFEVRDELVSLGFVSDIDYQRINSPKYYNFANDSIYVAIKLKDENITNIMNYLSVWTEEFAEYIKGKYTSRDGFISSYSNSIEDWLNTESLEHPHKLGSILDFILENEGFEESELHFRVMETYSPILEIKNDINELIKSYE